MTYTSTKNNHSVFVPHKHLNKAEVRAVEIFCIDHNIRWTNKRKQLLMMGSNGRMDVNHYKRYCKLLRRLEYEMRCRKEGLPIAIDNGSGKLTDRFY